MRHPRQIEGGLHDATLDKNPGSGMSFTERWDGQATRYLTRAALPKAFGWQVKLTVFEHNNPVPAWVVYGPEYVRPNAPLPQRQPHPSQRTMALLQAYHDQFLGISGGSS